MRVSKKIVLEYLESVYPDWKNFEQIADDLPVMFNFDFFELQARLDRLLIEGKIEKEFPALGPLCLGNRRRYRIKRSSRKSSN